MDMDYDQFKDAASEGSTAPKRAGSGLSDLESALDQIQRAKEMERRLQDEVGPSISDQVLELAQDPKIQRAAREIWYGPEGAAPSASSRSASGASDGPDRGESTPEVTPEVTDSEESGVTGRDLDPIQSDLTAVTNYQGVTRIDGGRDVLELGIATTNTGEKRVTVTDGDEIIQYRADEFMEWAEREGFYNPPETTEDRVKKLYKWIKENSDTKEEAVLFALVLHEYHGESSVFDKQKEIAEFLDTSPNYVRKVKSEHSGPVTLDVNDGEYSIEVTL